MGNGTHGHDADRGAIEADDVTRLVDAARSGDSVDRERLFDAIHQELKVIARSQRFVGRPGDSLQPTALVSELFIEFERRFPPPPSEQAENRATFYRSAALAMRSILRDHWRKNQAARRRPEQGVASLDATAWMETPATDDGLDASTLLAVDEALVRLEAFNRRWHDVVLHRLFTGRSIEETASLLGVSRGTVTDDWRLARSWLQQEIGG